MLTKEELPECPVATTVQLIGSKWKLLILRNLLQRPWRFNELRKSLEGISQKVLTDSLRSMEADGLITRTVYPEVPPRVEYALSDLGQSMRPIIQVMEDWGMDYKKKDKHGSAAARNAFMQKAPVPGKKTKMASNASLNTLALLAIFTALRHPSADDGACPHSRSFMRR